jgi:hypothetical protein
MAIGRPKMLIRKSKKNKKSLKSSVLAQKPA